MRQNDTRPVLIMAGGTGGHVFPALAVADRLRARGVPVVWLGTEAGLEARVVPAAGIPIEWMRVRGLRRNGVRGWLIAPFMVAGAVVQAWKVVRRHRPRAALGMGGYVAGPGALAARLAGVPFLIHEQNAVPGFTNRLLLRLARRALTGFAGVFGQRQDTIFTGNPIRTGIAALPAPEQREETADKVRLLVLGGSQGAQALNDMVPAALRQLPDKLRPEVWHQAGARGLDAAREAYRKHGVDGRVEGFIDDMTEAYRWADLAICRSGALTVAELAAAGVPAVLVPLPYAVDDHQTANARYLADQDAAVLCPQSELTAERLAAVIEQLAIDRDRLRSMALRARALARPDAADEVARYCLEAAE